MIFILKKKMVIFGDTTPDKSVEDLEKNFLSYEQKFPKTSTLIKKNLKKEPLKIILVSFIKSRIKI